MPSVTFSRESTRANKASSNIGDRNGDAPLQHFSRAFATNKYYFTPNPLNVLLKHGANLATTNHAGQPPLHILAASSRPHPHTMEILRYIVAPSNAAYSVRDQNGDTPLHLWARSMPNCYPCSELFGKISSQGGIANLTNNAGQTPVTLLMLNASNKP